MCVFFVLFSVGNCLLIIRVSIFFLLNSSNKICEKGATIILCLVSKYAAHTNYSDEKSFTACLQQFFCFFFSFKRKKYAVVVLSQKKRRKKNKAKTIIYSKSYYQCLLIICKYKQWFFYDFHLISSD